MPRTTCCRCDKALDGKDRRYCRACASAQHRDYYERNRETIRARQTAYNAANRDRVNAANKRYKEAHPKESREAVVRWIRENPDRAAVHYRRSALKRMYGMTLEQYEALFDAQHGCCAICREFAPEDAKLGFLQVDHDHDTGAIRGLLCGTCNRGLGSMHDDPARLRAAADYIEEFNANQQEETG